MNKEVSDKIYVSFVKMLKKVSFSFNSSNIETPLNDQITRFNNNLQTQQALQVISTGVDQHRNCTPLSIRSHPALKCI